jgi:hypothetical protein
MAMRLWSLPLRDPGGQHPDWRPGFVAAGIVRLPAFCGINGGATTMHSCPRLVS